MEFRVLNNFVHIYHLLSLVYGNSVNLMTLGLVFEPLQLSNFLNLKYVKEPCQLLTQFLQT